MITIRVPCSTANLGPGFDTLGAALSMHLTIKAQKHHKLEIQYTGVNADEVSLIPTENLITRVVFYVANCYNQVFDNWLLTIDNPIPLGRGLGSSASAIVGGVVLASETLELNLSQQELLDLVCTIEGHPDNAAPSLLGGMICSYCRHDIPELEDSFFLPGNQALRPPERLTQANRVKVSPKIHVVVVIPEFHLATSLARSVLPKEYKRSDVIFNLGRLAVLTQNLGKEDPDPLVIGEAMQDKIHQPYRQALVPGLDQILKLTFKDLDGLLGICLSGAGPCILAFCLHSQDMIGQAIVDIFANHTHDGTPIQSEYKVLQFDTQGTVVTK
ncbi:ribosomal protein S5 domain 2-type protein [Gorgonomyces haynaldii]|nr:ribosomal protein S5 domain 2-type protein [Gorgonomyces haynaldii]